MGKLVNMVGKKYGRLTALKRVGVSKGGAVRWLFECDCGNKKVITGTPVRNGTVASCGCYNREKSRVINTTHGMSDTRIYQIWGNMKQRCQNENNPGYKYYGAKGVSVCDRWEKFENFYNDMGESYEKHLNKHGEKQTQLERIDNSACYCSSNCCWATQSEQRLNYSRNHYLTYNSETKTITEWAKDLGMNRQTLYGRINQGGWSIKKALTEPPAVRDAIDCWNCEVRVYKQ